MNFQKMQYCNTRNNLLSISPSSLAISQDNHIDTKTKAQGWPKLICFSLFPQTMLYKKVKGYNL